MSNSPYDLDISEERPKAKNRPPARFPSWAILAIVLGAIVVGFVTLIAGNNLGSGRTVAATPTAGPESIVEQVKLTGELTTVKTQMAKAGFEVRTYFGAINICQVGARYVARATILAGIDFDSLQASDVTIEDNGRIVIQLPAPRVLDCILDTAQTQRYRDWGISPLCPIEVESMDRLANHIALTDFRQTAVEEGVLETAKKQAAVVIRNVIKLSGKEITIKFKDPVTSAQIPSSCSIDPPDGWSLRDDGTWTR